ncbi:MAG: PspC domain-containing protein [Acidimicrobiales bacterium]|nr:PspC domain-containing protein [Acidimicrobiales bacterium]
MSTITDDPTLPQPPDDGDGDRADGGPGDGAPVDPSGTRPLRRSADDRVLVGVAGGLGHHFGVDPVLLRILFAVTAFFGGIGVLAYALGWALLPEEGAVDPPVDRLVEDLRHRGVALWILLGTLSVLFWIFVLPDWSPFGLGPIAIAVVIIAIALSKRAPASTGPTDPNAPAGPTAPTRPLGPTDPTQPFAPIAPHQDPTAPQPASQTAPAPAAVGGPGYPTGYSVADPTQAFGPPPEPPDVRRWEAQARVMTARTAARESQRAARQERRARMAPARWGSFGALVVTLGVLIALDATRGIPISTYGWALVAVGLVSLVVGGLFRRTPWLNVLWVLVGLSIIATFGTSAASLSDGTGDQLLVPRSEDALPDEVRLAFGRTTVDLTELPAGAGRGHTMEIHQAAGAIVLRVPQGMRVAIHAGVHLGAVTVDEVAQVGGDEDGGRQFDEGPTGLDVFTVDAHLAVGNIEIDHVSPGEERARERPTPPDPAGAPEPTTPPVPTVPSGDGTR